MCGRVSKLLLNQVLFYFFFFFLEEDIYGWKDEDVKRKETFCFLFAFC